MKARMRGGGDDDLPAARQLAARGCALHQARCCAAMALFWDTGYGGAYDPAKGDALARASCEQGDSRGCAELGRRHTLLGDVPASRTDYARALLLADRECAGGEGASCVIAMQLGLLAEPNLDGVEARLTAALALGWGYEEMSRWRAQQGQVAEAVAILEKGCGADNRAACDALGDRLILGQDVERDVARGRALLERACKGGEADGCIDLSSLYQRGQVVAEDRPRALALALRSCNLMAETGCHAAAVMIESGFGAAIDPVRAFSLHRLACHDGDADSCISLAVMLHEGRGAAKDDAGAAAALRQACTLGSADGCARAKGLE
jgi:TPR repeat protein